MYHVSLSIFWGCQEPFAIKTSYCLPKEMTLGLRTPSTEKLSTCPIFCSYIQYPIHDFLGFGILMDFSPKKLAMGMRDTSHPYHFDHRENQFLVQQSKLKHWQTLENHSRKRVKKQKTSVEKQQSFYFICILFGGVRVSFFGMCSTCKVNSSSCHVQQNSDVTDTVE